MAMRIVEVEKAECQHMHAWNYDPDDAKRGFPLKELPNGQMKCMDCGELFYPAPLPPTRYTLNNIRALAEQWATENEATTDARWIVSGLLAWLAKREQGEESGR